MLAFVLIEFVSGVFYEWYCLFNLCVCVFVSLFVCLRDVWNCVVLCVYETSSLNFLAFSLLLPLSFLSYPSLTSVPSYFFSHNFFLSAFSPNETIAEKPLWK